MFKLFRNVRSVAILLVASLVLAACGGGVSPASTAKDKVSVQLAWTHEYSYASLYAAEKNGHFAKENLEVSLTEGGFKDGKFIDTRERVLSGSADFGMTSASGLILARAKGQALVAVAAIVQRSPQAIISLAKSNIKRPQDLIGKKVSIVEGDRALYNTLLTSQQIDPAQVTTIPRTASSIEPLLKGEVDAMLGWIINEGVLVREAGQEPNFMLLSDYGLDSYNVTLFTTDKMIQERPQVVERFVRAVTLGIKDVVAAPESAVQYALSYGKNLDKDAQRRRLDTALPLLNPAGSKPGMMQEAIWKVTYQLLLDNKVLEKPLDFHVAYTMDFLNKVYS